MLRGGLLAAGAALIAWYFLDPKKGAERRENVAKKAKDLYDNAGTELNRLGHDLSTTVSDVVDQVSSQISTLTGSKSQTTTADSRQEATA